jgi:hypothetical protein
MTKRERIAEIVAMRDPEDTQYVGPAPWHYEVADRILALDEGERIEGSAANDVDEPERVDFYRDPVRPDGYLPAYLVILHPEAE